MTALVSMSGGKDSTATLLIALESEDRVIPVFADTGNEHEAVYEYLLYLETRLGIEIVRLKQDFSDWWWRRREYVANKWPEKGVDAETIRRALEVYDAGPTGNPYLDLCIIKNRFPSRKAQFCTQYLKTEPLTEYALDLIDREGEVVSWQGVRAEESPNRARLPQWEDRGGGLTIFHPILRWTAEQVFALHRCAGVEPNPLYRLGMGRVGCMPCINASKGELRAIARRFPHHIDRIAAWEDVVARASKRANATFFPAPGDADTATSRGSIGARVQWSFTLHGGKVVDESAHEELPACASAYGLCE